MEANYDLSSLDFKTLACDYDYFTGYSEGRWSEDSHVILLPFPVEVVQEWIGMVQGQQARASLVVDIVQYFAVKNDEWLLSTYPDWGDERDLQHYTKMGMVISRRELNTVEDMPILMTLGEVMSLGPQLCWEMSLSAGDIELEHKLLGMLWTSRGQDCLRDLPWYRIAETLYEAGEADPVEEYMATGFALEVSKEDVEMALIMGGVLDLPDKLLIPLPRYLPVKKKGGLSSDDLLWIKDKLFYYLHAWATKTNNATYQLGRLLTIGLGPVLGLTSREVHNEIGIASNPRKKDLSALVRDEIEKSLAGGVFKDKLPAEKIQESVTRLRETVGELKTLLLADLLQHYLNNIERADEAYAVEPDADRNPDVDRDEELDDVAEMLMDVDLSEQEDQTEPHRETEDEQHSRAMAFIAAVIGQGQ